MTIFSQQNRNNGTLEKSSKIRHLKEPKKRFCPKKMKIPFNKRPFLSLILAQGLLTFVPYSNSRMKHLPMNELKINFLRFLTQPRLRRSLPILVGMVVFCLQLHAQGWEIYFGSNSDDFGYSIVQTQDQGFAAAGFSQSVGDYDVYVIRTDVDGRELWSKIYDEEIGRASCRERV